MFTGIIQEIGTVARIQRSKGLVRLEIDAPRLTGQIRLLESVAVNGVCLTVVKARRGHLAFEVITETQRLTTLGVLREGSRVNLEPSLLLTDRLNGHLVFGHVDGMGRVTGCWRLPGEIVLRIQVPASLRRWLIPKGPVAVEGVSLTVGQRMGSSGFQVHLIPETLRQTTLAARCVGDPVNIELDYLGKLVVLLASRRS